MSIGPTVTSVDSARQPHQDTAYAWYVAIILSLCQMVSYIDRWLINLLVGPIKADFQLSDTQIGLLLGLAFTVIHVLLAIPLGRLVDRGSRRNIILICGLFWSIASIAAGFSKNYETLFLSRMGVGAAEAGMYPAATALVAAYFTRKHLPRALSIVLMGPFIGGGISLIFGGLVIGALDKTGAMTWPIVGVLQPWQMTFVIVSSVCILPILLMLTVREPPRPVSAGQDVAKAATPAMREALRYLVDRRRFYLFLYLGFGLHVVSVFAVPAWGPTWLIRHFDLTTAEVGVRFGVVSLVAGSLGMLAGPFIGRFYARRGHVDSSMRGVITAMCICPLVALAMPFAPTPTIALILLFALSFAYTLPLALSSSALQEVTPDRMRGFTAAIYFVASAVLGMTMGPTLVSLMTDYVFRDPQQVGWSLGIVVAGAALLSLICYVVALGGHRALLGAGTDREPPAASQ